MKHKLVYLLITLGALFYAHSASAVIVNFNVSLSGANEVSNGDPDGTGTAWLSFDSIASTVSWHIEVFDIGTIIGAHIHNAPAGVNGGVVVNFSGSLDGTDLFDSDVSAILGDPTNYYVNVHTSEHPSGAVRGQLGRPVPDSFATYLAALPLGLLFFIRARSKRR